MQPKRVNEIDLLRFLAALSVVLFHYAFRGYAADGHSVMPYLGLAPVAKYGFLGVQLFFMISGFVILMTAAQSSLRDFAISRLVRLYPAFWVSCTATFLVILGAGAPRFSASFVEYLENMTMLGGFFDVHDMDGAYWSLYVEIRFYVLVALVLILGRIEQAQAFLISWLVVSAALTLFPVDKLREWFVVDYSAFFIAGAAYYLIWSKGLSRTRITIVLASFPLALLSVSGMDRFVAHYHTALDGRVVAGIVLLFFVAMGLVATGLTGWLGRRRWALAGAVTYPLYLLHGNIGYIIFNAEYPRWNAHVLLWGTLVFMILLAYAVNVVIERPVARPMKAGLNRAFDLLERWFVRMGIRTSARS